MATSYILALDQGTTGSTALIVAVDDSQAKKTVRVCQKATVEFSQHYPQPGWVEHNLDEIWQSVLVATSQVVARANESEPGFSARRLVAIGVTNQRETLCVFEKSTGRPLRRAIVWQCRRSSAICELLKKSGEEAAIRQATGLVLDPYFSASKLRWIMENDSESAALIRSGKALVGTIDTFLLYRITGGKAFATEPSNASRTMLYNINNGKWDSDLLQAFKVPTTDCLPEVKDSSGTFGLSAKFADIPDGIPVSGILGDQQAALAGQTCFTPGDVKCTYGTGAFLLMNTGDAPIVSREGLLTTVAWETKGRRSFALEGSCFIAGAAVQFLRDQLKFFAKSPEIEALASNEPAAPHLYFVPALTGLGAPYWNPEARGALLGLTRGSSRGEIARAVLEGIAFQVSDVVHAMERDLIKKMTRLRVDGGAAANEILLQIQSDLLDAEVDRPKNIETTALGAAMFAGLGIQLFAGFEELSGARVVDKIFHPSSESAQKKLIREQLEGWKRAVDAVQLFARRSG